MNEKDVIDYGKLIDDAMHVIVQRALNIVVDHGLPSDHHFFISFLTNYPGVQISKALLDKYPEEMTIVLQYQFQDLIVDDKGFSVTLSFDNIKEKLRIPFAALTAFADPSVKFGLQFRHLVEDDDEDDEDFAEVDDFTAEDEFDSKKKEGANTKKSKPLHSANVIALDSFRKK